MPQDIIAELRGLGISGLNRDKNAHAYFVHTSGKVPLEAVTKYYDTSIGVADRAASEIERLRNEVARLSGGTT